MGGCETFVRWQLLAGKTKVELQHDSFSQEYNSKVFGEGGEGDCSHKMWEWHAQLCSTHFINVVGHVS